MPILSQVTVWQNPETGEITCEVGAAGGRRKIRLNENDPQSWGAIIKSELDAASAWERKIQAKNKPLEDHKKKREEEIVEAKRKERVAAQTWDKHRKNYDVTTSHHGSDTAEYYIGPRNKNSKRRLTIFDRIL